MNTPSTVIYDSCILFPPSLRDLFVWLGITGACRPRWTVAIHEEWTRSVLAFRADVAAASLARCRRLMDAAVPDGLVMGYEPLIPTLTLPDADDRHVLAAAIHAGAENIVTFNLKDSPEERTRAYGVAAIHPDAFLIQLLEGFEDEVCQAVQNQRGLLKTPPEDDLGAPGHPRKSRPRADRLLTSSRRSEAVSDDPVPAPDYRNDPLRFRTASPTLRSQA